MFLNSVPNCVTVSVNQSQVTDNAGSEPEKGAWAELPWSCLGSCGCLGAPAGLLLWSLWLQSRKGLRARQLGGELMLLWLRVLLLPAALCLSGLCFNDVFVLLIISYSCTHWGLPRECWEPALLSWSLTVCCAGAGRARTWESLKRHLGRMRNPRPSGD